MGINIKIDFAKRLYEENKTSEIYRTLPSNLNFTDFKIKNSTENCRIRPQLVFRSQSILKDYKLSILNKWRFFYRLENGRRQIKSSLIFD
jgi:hypothetical protein